MDNGVTRRRVLSLLGAGAAIAGMVTAPGVASADVEASGRCRRIPRRGIGMHLYTVRDILNADPLGTLTALADIGYACVGVSAFNRPAAEIRDLCEETHLNPVILHVGHGDITGDWAAKLADAKTIGVRWVVLSSFPSDMYTVEGIRLGAQQLNEAGAAARELGMGMLHVKDHDDQGNWTDVGSGVIDWARIFEKADRAGVRYWLVERDDQPAPLDTSRNSYNYLASLRF